MPVQTTPNPEIAELERLGNEIAELSAHLEVANARLCDANRVVMGHDADGRTVEISARARTIPPALRRVLQHRDRGCRFPGCGLPFTQGHHIRHWAQGGPTTLSNLVLVCRRHHRSVHEDGFQLQRLPNGDLEFQRPNGWLIPEAPPLPPVRGDVVGDLRAVNEAAGLYLNGRRLGGTWGGERFSVAWAIDCMHPRAIGH